MKKALVILFIFIAAGVQAQYNPSLHTVTNKSLGIAQGVPTDARSMFFDTIKYKPRYYKNRAEVLAWLAIPKYRAGSFPIFVNTGGVLQADSLTFVGGGTMEYWFRNGIADSNLVLKSNDVSQLVKYSDSIIKYVTPTQLKDSLVLRISGKDTFTRNIHIYTPLGWGKYPQNSDIPAIGKTIQQVVTDVFTVTIPPPYYLPTAGITGSPGGGNYEIGTSLTVNLTSTFTQNDAGNLNGTAYYVNGTSISGNVAVLSNITSNKTIYVSKAYAEGACKINNQGQVDCTGKIQAGSVNSGSINYNVYPTYYYGFSPSQTPSDANLRTLGNSFLSTTKTLSGGLPAPSSASYIVFAFPASYGAAAVTVNGLGVTFSLTQRIVVNASGNSELYNIYISPNPTSGAVASFAVN